MVMTTYTKEQLIEKGLHYCLGRIEGLTDMLVQTGEKANSLGKQRVRTEIKACLDAISSIDIEKDTKIITSKF